MARGRMAAAREYRFLTTWLLESARDPVWEAIFDQRSWPSWWCGVRDVVELDPGDASGVGSHSLLTWRSRLPYDLAFEARTRVVERPWLIEADATGELSGSGRWRLFEQQGVTAVLYEWNVSTTKPWMNALSPLLGPVFEWNHDWIMRSGGVGIARLLGCRLLAAD